MIPRWLVAGALVLLVAALLSLGLWPFHTPPNRAQLSQDAPGLILRDPGSALAVEPLRIPETSALSIEILAIPDDVDTGGTLFSLRSDQSGDRWNIDQIEDGLSATIRIKEGRGVRKDLLGTEGGLVAHHPFFFTVTSGPEGSRVYLEGVQYKYRKSFRLPIFSSGSLVIGDSHGQSESWNGKLRGIAIYPRELSAAEVMRHQHDWKVDGRPQLAANESILGLYLFDERHGRSIRNHAGNGPDLTLPADYHVPDKSFLEPFWTAYGGTPNWSDLFNNVVGFMPLGWLGFSLWRRLGSRRAFGQTLLLGFGISLTIEVIQGLVLETRESDSTDLLTNTLGTWVGAIMCRFFLSWLDARCPAAKVEAAGQ